MALILERLDGRRAEPVERVALDRLPLTIGRALDNDLVLDDPHVDPHHARVVAAGDGTAVLEDLGSVNGIALHGGDRADRLPLVAGTMLRLGRTGLRVRDRAESVAPALPLTRFAPARHWLDHRRWQLALIAAALGAVADASWTGTSTRDGLSETLGIVVAATAFLAIWAAAWAVVGKLVVRRAAFLNHAAIAAATVLAVALLEAVTSWGQFLFPAAARVFDGVDWVMMIAITCVMLSAHLVFSTALTSRARWVGVLSVVGGFIVLSGAFALVKDDAFTDVPEFVGELKRAPAALIPAGDLESFRAAAAATRVRMDSLKQRPAADAREE
ncbi:MAG: FHA domain-containing protein [Gemmatimonadaceae bacterium]